MLDIITGREKTKYDVARLDNVLAGVAEVFERRAGKPREGFNIFPTAPELEHEDKLLAQEVFWDLMIEKIITPGLNFPNSELPYFRLHSEIDPKKVK